MNSTEGPYTCGFSNSVSVFPGTEADFPCRSWFFLFPGWISGLRGGCAAGGVVCHVCGWISCLLGGIYCSVGGFPVLPLPAKADIQRQFPSIISNEDAHQAYSLDRNSKNKWRKKPDTASSYRNGFLKHEVILRSSLLSSVNIFDGSSECAVFQNLVPEV